jgi:ABC-type dipeptide/oligopeptide/nickel transport system ATPase component/ABC-type dipeptide/oligopeptide/nickel transport system permease subunit
MSAYADLPVPTPVARVALLRRLLRNPTGLVASGFLAVVALVAVAGSALAPYDPATASFDLILAPPSSEHWLGGDSAGRDVLSRLLVATQVSMGASLVALLVALVMGVTGGLLAGYYGGSLDGVGSWFTSIVMALPAVIVLLAARAAFGPSVWISMAIFGILLSPAFFRLVHASVTAVRGELYVDAARVAGLSDPRIIGRHVLTVVRAPIIIQSAVVLGIAIAVQSGLEFLGLGDLSLATWGSMLNDGFMNIYRAPVLMLWPSLAIVLTSMALVLLSSAARDELERAAPVRRRRPPPASRPLGRPTVATIRHEEGRDPGDEDPILSIRELCVGYDRPGGRPKVVVDAVSLDVRRGEVHGLVGESGSGKTQTAFAVLGLLPAGGRVLGGTARLGGQVLVPDAGDGDPGVRGRRIGYVPQEPMSNLDPSFTIGSQLVEPMRAVLRIPRSEAVARALALLDRVGIPDPRRTFAAYPHQISGGMAQRVLIAGAIACDPELLIADEPTTALDVTVQAGVLDLLRDLQEERRLSVLLVTHNFGVVADLCDSVSVMRAGRIVETGPVRSVFADPRDDHTRALLAATLDGAAPRAPYVERPEVTA